MLLQPFISIVDAELFKTILLQKQECTMRYYLQILMGRVSGLKKSTSKDSKPYISRMLIDLPVRRLPTASDLLICSTSHSNRLAYSDFANASLVSIA